MHGDEAFQAVPGMLVTVRLAMRDFLRDLLLTNAPP
jgi:hypothetical protein